ncbi:conserved hypothetical protein [Shewanella halifaxensis HAW-EB4]|uniref:Uncharacterized protein n=1 Tax=Shewanella halifaxensis (strain HAW-EB4) TaxID=458817 RepID=B0TS06_SHEHH|nr:hypothetical protein [Shewanella halifaxensis]ABZ77918.1 conserved hypothetical protein [Shewanella halifaxensis HAW-EB4]
MTTDEMIKAETTMQEQLPITISADSGFSSSLKPLLVELEMWLNFQALKADWYGDEACILAFDFTLVRSLEDKALDSKNHNWVTGEGYAYYYDSTSLKTTAFIAVADLLEAGVGIEQAIKARLIAVANEVAKSVARGHRLLALV